MSQGSALFRLHNARSELSTTFGAATWEGDVYAEAACLSRLSLLAFRPSASMRT